MTTTTSSTTSSSHQSSDRPAAHASLARYAWLSIAAAVTTIGLKTAAYLVTGSVGLLSDALESLVNLAAALMALAMLTVAARPPDELHAYGHGKAEYFSSAVEGSLIIIAAGSIVWTAIPRLIDPQPLPSVDIGLIVASAAAVVNFAVARIILRAGIRHRSITIEADAHHLMTDVWTSVGVIAGVGLVAVTDWEWLDPVIALVVGANIVRTGVRLLRRSIDGLMDGRLPPEELQSIDAILERYKSEGIEYHALRTRQAGRRKFISLHVLVPGDWTVQKGHGLLDDLEEEIERALPGATVFTHMEPLDDPSALRDIDLDRTPREG